MRAVGAPGAGMDGETQSRFVEPFFTTKKTGSGLGLATVYGIVAQSGGSITVQSAPNEGSTFNIYLPVAGGVEGLTAVPANIEPSALEGNGTILLVDDEDALREAVGEYLEGCGYSVLKARDGKEGIKVSDSYNGSIE